MPPPDLGQYGDGADAGSRLQDGHDFGVPDLVKRIGPPPASGRLLLGRQPWIFFDPIAGRRAEPRLGGGDGGIVGLLGTHVQPHLVARKLASEVVGDVEAGQRLIPSIIETNQQLHPVARDRQTAPPIVGEKARHRCWTALGRATPSLRQPSIGAFSS